MTGPEHYREAERLLADAETIYDVTVAQVHATLALAAATAIQPHAYGMNRAEAKAWIAAALTPEADYDVKDSFA